jgi:hypothetical protein
MNCAIVTRSYGLTSFGTQISHQLSRKSPKPSSGLPRFSYSTLGIFESYGRNIQYERHTTTCQAVASEAPQTAGDSTLSAATTTAAYSKLQNGSDIRGVALDSTFSTSFSCHLNQLCIFKSKNYQDFNNLHAVRLHMFFPLLSFASLSLSLQSTLLLQSRSLLPKCSS